MIKNYFLLLLVILLLLLTGCKNTSRSVTSTPTPTPVASESIAIYTPLYIPLDSINAIFHKLHSPEATRQFYTVIKYSAIWFNGSTRTGRADSLLSFLRDTRYYGLLRNNYHYDIIEHDLSKPEAVLHLDILLTDAFLSLARDLKYGRRPPKNPYAIDSLTNGVLIKALQEQNIKKILREQEPVFREYRHLKTALQIALDTLDHETRQLLLTGATDDFIATQKQIKLIEINLERWREENSIRESRYISVNIPSFLLQVINADTLILESRVIVGTPEKQTPEISSRIECITIYPYWHVPRKIIVEEYLPLIKQDTTFLQRNNFDVLNREGKVLRRDSIDWKKFNTNYFPVTLRQREGVENSLGVIKFQFDNPYAVYLHDTNAKRLFRNKVRAYSHGCVRVEKAEELAHYLVTGITGKKSKTIEKYFNQKKQHIVSLTNAMPIYIRYFTCAYTNNKFTMYNDIYKKDEGIAALLYAPRYSEPVTE